MAEKKIKKLEVEAIQKKFSVFKVEAMKKFFHQMKAETEALKIFFTKWKRKRKCHQNLSLPKC